MSTVVPSLPEIVGFLDGHVGIPIGFYSRLVQQDLTQVALNLNQSSTGDIVVRISDGVTDHDVTIPGSSSFVIDTPSGVTFAAGGLLTMEVVSLAVPFEAQSLGGNVTLVSTPVAAGTGPYLTDVATVRLYLKDPDIANDSLISLIVAGTSEAMERWMGRSITQDLTSRYLTAHASGPLVLDQWPVDLTDNGNDEGVFDPADQVTPLDPTSYEISGRMVYPSSSGVRGIWGRGTQLVVKGLFGYATVPAELYHACTMEVVSRFNAVNHVRVGVSSMSTELGDTQSYVGGNFLPETIEAMFPFRRSL